MCVLIESSRSGIIMNAIKMKEKKKRSGDVTAASREEFSLN